MPKGIGNFFNRVTRRDRTQNAQNQNRRGIQPPQPNANQPQVAQGAGRIAQAGAQNLQNRRNPQRQNNEYNGLFALHLSPGARQMMAGLDEIDEDDDAYDEALYQIMGQMIAQLAIQEAQAEQQNQQAQPPAEAQNRNAVPAQVNQQPTQNQRAQQRVAGQNRQVSPARANQPPRQSQPAQQPEQRQNLWNRVDTNDMGDMVRLTELRAHRNEPDHQLVTIPEGRRVRNMRIVQPNSHPATDNLQGSEYVKVLGQDISLRVNLTTWVNGRHVLGQVLADEQLNTAESRQRVTNTVDRLRMIASAARSDNEMSVIIDRNAKEALRFCNDRSGFYLNTMYGQAYIYHVTEALQNGRDQINPADLFNLGVAHFRLDALHSLIFQDRRNGIRHSQGVHTILEAELMLQDRLDLPVHHDREQIMSGGLTQAMADNLADRVEQATIEDGGSRVWAFMSTWGPWVNYISELPHVNEQMKGDDGMESIFHGQLEDLITLRNVAGSVYHSMSEEDFNQETIDLRDNLADWLRVVVAENTWTFLINYRTNIHMDRKNMPRRLQQN